ncbi:MAG: hypothetical protein A2Y34_13000 [Spirochaetes bacterium GWC1_27_15]|nr:MAG: hypothetical protein A2Z98_04805 [Spirochaetes bacterium GWB1_27_13]OHD20519.1 MAG: hypothetical protein A2Y34_13000 [Spirochaetes bacterium GWC1_27_15]
MQQEKTFRSLIDTAQFIKKIGDDGSFGDVGLYKYFPKTRYEKSIAIKCLKNIPHKDYNSILESFKKEALILNKLKNHPNIVKIYSYKILENMPYIIMEYVSPYQIKSESINNLEKLIKHQPTILTDDFILLLLFQISHALSYAYENNIRCHGDLTLKNILINSDCSPKIVDFGLSAITNFTREDFYKAPEVNKNLDLCEISDIYSLGVVFIQLLNKKKFENEKDFENAIEDKKNNSKLFLLLNKMVSKDKKHRFQSFKNILDVLSKDFKTKKDILFSNDETITERLRLLKDFGMFEEAFDLINKIENSNNQEVIDYIENTYYYEYNNPELISEIADTYYSVGEYNKTIQILFSFIESSNILNAPLIYMLANSYEAINEDNKAIELYSICIKNYPDFQLAYMNKAYTLFKLGLNEESLEILNNILQKFYGQIENQVYLNIGKAYASMKNYDLAKEYFIKYERLNPVDKNNLFNIGQLYLIKGDIKEAKKYINNCLIIDPNDKDALLLKSRLEMFKEEEKIMGYKRDYEDEVINKIRNIINNSTFVGINFVLRSIKKENYIQFNCEIRKETYDSIKSDFECLKNYNLLKYNVSSFNNGISSIYIEVIDSKYFHELFEKNNILLKESIIKFAELLLKPK